MLLMKCELSEFGRELSSYAMEDGVSSKEDKRRELSQRKLSRTTAEASKEKKNNKVSRGHVSQLNPVATQAIQQLRITEQPSSSI